VSRADSISIWNITCCGLDDDLPHVIDKLGSDFIVTATDFPHALHFVRIN
jgi:hypothetical protein